MNVGERVHLPLRVIMRNHLYLSMTPEKVEELIWKLGEASHYARKASRRAFFVQARKAILAWIEAGRPTDSLVEDAPTLTLPEAQ